MRRTSCPSIALILFLFSVIPQVCSGNVSKTFVAYSLKVAQARVEEAMLRGEDFRRTQADLFFLAGITKPAFVVLDEEQDDWVLVGERDPTGAVLSLDDWVCALRARFIHGDRDPGVTIDPRPPVGVHGEDGSSEVAVSETQDVRFFGGIENTHFGHVCYEADWLMKRVSLGMEDIRIENIESCFDLAVREARGAAKLRKVSSRFWFFPVMNRVNVFEGLILLEKFRMGLFTEVLRAEFDGVEVEDLKSFQYHPHETFARSFTENFDAAAEAWEVLGTLRGLTMLSGLAEGLAARRQGPALDFYLTTYPVAWVETPSQKEVLTAEDAAVGLIVSGGVALKALVLSLQSENVSALVDLVRLSRREAGPDRVSWSFQIEVADGQPVGIRLPSRLEDDHEIVPMIMQADFLAQKKYYDEAIALYSQVVDLAADYAPVYEDRGWAYLKADRHGEALADFNKLVALLPDDFVSYFSRGSCYSIMDSYTDAIEDFTRSVQLNQNFALGYSMRGDAYFKLGEDYYDAAIADCNRAIAIDSTDSAPFKIRGACYGLRGNYDQAILDLTRAVSLDSKDAQAYLGRAALHELCGNYEAAIRDISILLELGLKSEDIETRPTTLYKRRAELRLKNGAYGRALEDFSKAVELDPDDPELYQNRALINFLKSEWKKVVADVSQLVALGSARALDYHMRALAYGHLGRYDEAIADCDEAISLNPDFEEAEDWKRTMMIEKRKLR